MLLSFFLLIATTGLLVAMPVSLYSVELLRRGVRGFVAVVFLLCAVVLITGLLRQPDTLTADGHGALGRWIVIFVWLSAGAVVALILRRACNLKTAIIVLATSAVGFLSSYTGYLGPNRAARHGMELDAMTVLRFEVSHQVVLPLLLGVLLLAWVYALKPTTAKVADGSSQNVP